MALGSRLLERAFGIRRPVRERVIAARATKSPSVRLRSTAESLYLEPLESRMLLAIGAIPGQINPDDADQAVFVSDSTTRTIGMDAAGPASVLFKFALDGVAFTNDVSFSLQPASLSSGSDAALALYDESGNLINSADADVIPTELGIEEMTAEIESGRVHVLGVHFAPAGPPIDYTLVVTAEPQVANTSIVIDPSSGVAHLDADTDEDTFNTPTDVDFYPLDLFNGGPGGAVTITPTGLDVKVFATVFRQDTLTETWAPIDSGSDAGGGPVSLSLTPPTNKSLQDGEFMLGVAPLDYNSAARSYAIDVATTSQLAPVDVSGEPVVEDFQTPLPFSLGLGRVVHSDTLAVGGSQVFKFLAPADTTGQATVRLQSVGFEPLVSVYDEFATTLLEAASMTVAGNAEISLPVSSGEAFLVRVGDVGNNGGGVFTLTVETPYIPNSVALNPLVSAASVTELNALTIGSDLGASVFGIQPAFGVDVLAVELGTAGNTGAKIALRGSNLPLLTKEIVPGETLFLPVDLAGVPGPIEVYVAGTSTGTDTATLKIGQVDVPYELDLDDFQTQKLDLNGDLNVSFAGGAFGTRVGEKHYQVVTDPAGTTVILGDGLNGAVPTVGQPILARYRQGGTTTMDLVSFALPTEAGPAVIDTVLSQDEVHGLVVIAMNFDGTDTIRIDVNGPDADFVGVGMVPDPPLQLPDPPQPPNFIPNPLVEPPPPYFSVLKIRDIVFEHDFERHLWKTLLPFNMLNNAVPQITLKSSSNATTSPFFGTMVTVMDENLNVIKSALNFPGGPVLTIDLNNIDINQFRGEPLLFQVEPLQNQLLNDGFYTLEMQVETDNPFPFLVTETAWRFPGSILSILPADQGNVATFPTSESVQDIVQNQFGDGFLEGEFTSSLPFDSGLGNNTGSIDVFRFWVETPGPVTVRTVPISAGVNTNIKLYQPRFHNNGNVLYLGQIPNVEPSFDWFPADRSQIDAQTYVNDFEVMAFDGFAANLSRRDYEYFNSSAVGVSTRLSGGFYYAVVKNEQGTKGQYRIEVDAPSFPLLGNLPPRGGAVSSFVNARDDARVTYTPPTGGAVTIDSGVAFTEDITDFVGYYPIQLPDYHSGALTVTPNFLTDWDFDLFDSDGMLLAETITVDTQGVFTREISDFSLIAGPQTVFLRVQERGTVLNSLAPIQLESTPRAFPLGFGPPPSILPSNSITILPSDPFGNATVDSIFTATGQSQAFSFPAASGPITVNVAPKQGNSLRLRWGVYVDSRLIAWDQTDFSDDTSLFGTLTEGTTTAVTLPAPRPPLDTPDYFFDTAPLHDVAVYVEALDAPANSGQFTVTVESPADLYVNHRQLAMSPRDLFAAGSANNVDGNDWLRLDVPDDLVGLVDLHVDLLNVILGGPTAIRVDVYDLKGNLLTSRTESTAIPTLNSLTIDNLEGTLPGNSYFLRVSRVVHTGTLMNLTASALLPKASPSNDFLKPPVTLEYFDETIERIIQRPDGIFNVGFPSWPTPNTFFALSFWVDQAGIADFSGILSPAANNSYLALYRLSWEGPAGEFPYQPSEYVLTLVDYTNEVNATTDTSGNTVLSLSANLVPGAYVVKAVRESGSGLGRITMNLPDTQAKEVVLDPNFGLSLLPRYLDTTDESTRDGFGNGSAPTNPPRNHVVPAFRTSFYKVVAPSGSQAAMLAAAINLPVGDTGNGILDQKAWLNIWRQNDLGFFFREGFDPVRDAPIPNPPNDIDPPNQPLGQVTTSVDAKPGQDFWMVLTRDALDTKIGVGAQFVVPFSGDPDLATEVPVLSANNGQTRVDVTVRNLGFAPALFFDRRYQFTDTSKNPDHTTISDKLELPIGPLGSRSFVYDWVPVRPADFVEYFADFVPGDPNGNIDEPDETNNNNIQFLEVVDPTRPSVSLALDDPLLDGNSNPAVWGRYISGVPGVYTDVIITGEDPDDDLYQVIGSHPNLSGFPSLNGQFYIASQSGSEDTSNINGVDFGLLEYTNPQNPNKFKMRAKDAFGLLSDEAIVTAQVAQFPGWLDNEDSELTFDQVNRRYDIMFRNALVDWGPMTVSQLAGFTVPFIGDKENRVLAEIKAEGTAGLNPDTAVDVPVTARVLVRILGQDIVNEMWTDAAQPTNHFALNTNLQINSQSLATDWMSVSFQLVDYPLFHWESPEITLFAYGVPDVASINAYLQFLVDAVLNAGVTIAIDPGQLQNPLQVPEILGLTTPTFVAPTITPGIEIGGEIEILGFDIASLSGTVSFGFTPALGLPSSVQNQLIPFNQFLTHACLGATGQLSGEITADVLGFEVYSFDLPSANINFNPSCSVVQNAPLPAAPPIPLAGPGDLGETIVFHGGDTTVGQLITDPVPNIVIDPTTGQALYAQVIDVDPGPSTRNNLVYAQRSGGVWSGALSNVAGGLELDKHTSNPVLALTHDDTNVPAVIVYQAIDQSGNVEVLTRNAFLVGQDIRYRYFDGTAWSGEQSLTNDSLYDTGQTVAFNSSGQGVAAWVHNTNPTPLSLSADPIVGAMDRAANEVHVAVWDATTHTWGAGQPLTVNNVADSKPTTFASEDGILYVLWIQDTVAGNQIMYSTNSGAGWSTPAALAINGLAEGKFTGVAVGSESAGRVDVLFSHVLEQPDLSTEVRLFNRPTTVAGFAAPAAPELVAENANFANLRAIQAPDGSLVAYWHQSDGATIDIFAATFDQATSTWSRPLRISDGDVEFTPSLAVDTDDTYQLVYENQMFLSPAPFPAPAGAPTVGMPVAGNVASTSTASLPDLSFSRRISFSLASEAPVGTVIASDAQIINRGPLADTVLVEYITGDVSAPILVDSEKIFLGAGARYDVDHRFQVELGVTNYSIRLTASAGAEVNGPADNVSTTMLLGAVDLAVGEVTLSNPDAVESETVTVTAEITNLSRQPIRAPFTLEYFQGDPDFTFDPASIVALGSQALTGINGFDTETITFPWTVPSGGGNFVLTVLADSDEEIAESTEFNNKGQSAVVVIRPDAAAQNVVATELDYSGVDNVEVTATVTNRGRAAVSNLEVQFLSTYDDLFTPLDDPSLMYADLGSSTIPLLMPGQTVDVARVAAGFAGLNNYRVIVDPQMNQMDGDWANNVADTSLILQGLSDLRVDILGLDPDDGMVIPMPIQGEALTVRTLVSNDGILTARDFKVEVFAINPAVGNLLVGSHVIADLAPLAAVNVDIPIDTAQLLGETNLLVLVDRLDKVLETDEDNNRDSIRVVFKLPNRVANRRVYYAGSSFVTTNSDGSPNNDSAIATDKEALMPGDDASFINYTNYDKGINGIIVDIEHPIGPLSPADFVFRVGNDDNPSRWPLAPPVRRFVVRPREGVNQSTRVEIGWDDGGIQNQWLQITVLANRITALPRDDVFYFGNAPGDTGDSASSALVNSSDVERIRANKKGPFNPPTIDDSYDLNRDGQVNATDVIFARDHFTSPSTALQLITPAPAAAAARIPRAPLPVLGPLAAVIDEDAESASVEIRVPSNVTANAGDATPATREFDRWNLKRLSTRARRIGINAQEAIKFLALDDVFADSPEWLENNAFT